MLGCSNCGDSVGLWGMVVSMVDVGLGQVLPWSKPSMSALACNRSFGMLK